MREGGIHVYTGDGKGKTTSAVGLAVRARSRGLRVLFAQFMKDIEGGETGLLEKLSVKVIRFEDVLSPLFNPDLDVKAVRAAAQRALETLGPMLGDYDLVVLDEFTHLITSGFVTREETVSLIGSRGTVDIVITGRGAPGWLLDMAEDVTEMKEIKHPSSSGTGARKGIEY